MDKSHTFVPYTPVISPDSFSNISTVALCIEFLVFSLTIM